VRPAAAAPSAVTRALARARRAVAVAALGGPLAVMGLAGPAAAQPALPAAGLAAMAPGGVASPASAPAAAAPALAATCPPPVLAPPVLPAPRDRGLLWRLERDGRVSWLYATVHAGRPHWAEPGPRLRAALDAADVLALEVDPADPAVLQAMQAVPAAPTLPPALQQRLDGAAARLCLPTGLLAPLHPVLQLATVTLLEGRWLGLDAAFGVELTLAAQARRRGLPVVALETAAGQMQALLPDPAADLAPQLEQGLVLLESQAARRQLERLVQAWEQGDLDTLQRYPEWCDCVHTDADRAALQRLNDDRNGPLAAAIAARHAAGQRVLAAIGALHMTGPQAVQALLAARGFSVRPVWPEPVAGGPTPRAAPGRTMPGERAADARQEPR